MGEHTLSLSEFKKFRKNLSHLVHFEQWTKRLEQLEAQVSEAENKRRFMNQETNSSEEIHSIPQSSTKKNQSTAL